MEPNAFLALLSNNHLITAVFACFSAQFIKVLLNYGFTGRINSALLFSTGGMPSSHSAFVVGMAASVGATEGLSSPLFALAAVFAFVVMHDAAGVRRAAGKHAEVINDLFERLEKLGVTPAEKLKELLGHSPVEVFGGAIWGLIIAVVAQWVLIW